VRVWFQQVESARETNIHERLMRFIRKDNLGRFRLGAGRCFCRDDLEAGYGCDGSGPQEESGHFACLVWFGIDRGFG